MTEAGEDTTMEPAVRDHFGAVAMPRANPVRTEFGVKASDKIVAFSVPSLEAGGHAGYEPEEAPVHRDWSAALDLIQETSEAIRITEERAFQLEERLQQVTNQAAAEMRGLEAQIVSAHELLVKSEERAKQAEQRALEAEAWLARLHDAVTTAFSRGPRTTP